MHGKETQERYHKYTYKQSLFIDVKENLLNQKETQDLIITSLDQQLKRRKVVNERMGIFDNLVKGLGKTPFIGQFMETDKILQSMEKTAGETSNKVSIMASGALEMMKNLISKV